MHTTRTRSFTSLTLGLALTTACGATPAAEEEALGSVEQGITRGELATDTGGPALSVVRLANAFTNLDFIPGDVYCTAVKIGPRRFLTAAHCGDQITPRVASPAKVAITNHPCHVPWPDGSGCSRQTGAVEIEVDRFYPHPNFRGEFGMGLDIGVLDVRVDTPSIPVAPLDTTFFPDYAEGFFYAYGCDETRLSGATRRENQKQFAYFIGMGLSDIPSALPHLTSSQATTHYNNNVLVDGTPISPHIDPREFVVTCKGDSGGPLFTNTGRIAAVNSGRFSGTPISVMARVAGVRSWITSAAPTITTRPGTLVNAATGRCLSASGSTASGATLVTAFCDGRAGTSDTQYWGATPAPASTTVFRNGKSKLCLASDGLGASSRITQRPCDFSSAAQQWFVGTGPLSELTNSNSALKLGQVAAPVGNGVIAHTADQTAQAGHRARWIVR